MDTGSKKASVAQGPSGDLPRAPIGRITGRAKVSVPMKSVDVMSGRDHLADVYAGYVRDQVVQLMDKYGSVPTEITVGFNYDE